MRTKLILVGCIISALAYSAEEPDTDFVQLEESVISTVGYETTLRNTPKNVQIITEKEIQDKNYQNVTDILRDSPLVTIRENEFGPIIDMRGSGLNSKATVQIMVDGISINPVDLNHGTVPINTVPVSNIEKVEIIPGGSGVLYGDGATGGVVNIITKSNVKKDTFFQAGARLGSYSSKQWDMSTGTGLGDKFGININYAGADEETHRSGEKSKRENFDISMNYDITPKDKVTLKYSYADEERDSAKMLTRAEVKADRFQSGIDSAGINSEIEGNFEIPNHSHIIRNDVMGVYEKDITENLKFNLLANYQKSENSVRTRDLTYINISPNFIQYADYYADTIGKFTEEKWRVSPSLKYIYMPDSYVIAGYDYKYQKSKRDFDNFSDMYKVYNLDTDKTSHGGYVFNKTTLDKFEFIQGYRREWTSFKMDKQTHYYHRVKPGFLNNGYVDTGLQREKFNKSMKNDAYEIAVNYLYSDTGNAFARFEQSFRTPSPTEFQDKDGTDYLINNLDAEINHSVELGIQDYILGSYVKATGFYTRTKGEIYYDMVVHGKEWYYSNLGRTERAGVELSLQQKFDKFILSENLSYIHSRIAEDDDHEIEGNRVPYAPKINFNITAKYLFTEKLNTVLTFNYKDKYYLDRANEYQAPSIITTDLAVNYSIKPGFDIYGGINNLLDRKSYSNVGVSDGELVYDPAASRNYYAGFRYTI